MRRLIAIAMTVLLTPGPASAQAQSSGATQGAQAELPVSLDRIRKGLEKEPTLWLLPRSRDDIPRFYLEIIGKPTFETFLKDFDLVNGPVPFSSPTHSEFLSMVTPKELYSSAGFGAAEVLQAAVMWKGVEWLARKAIKGAVDARSTSELNAIRDQIKYELGALEQARAQERAASAAAAGDLSALGWLAGCWQGATGDRVIEEQWMAPRGGTLIGMSRTVAGGRTIEHEFLQIRRQDDGVVYVARPSGQAEASFTLVSDAAALAREAVFENPQHDFPQRIIYRQQPDGSLLARVEGVQGGVVRGLDFLLKRAACQ